MTGVGQTSPFVSPAPDGGAAPIAANRIVFLKAISARLAPPHLARVRLGCRLAHAAKLSPQWAKAEREGDGAAQAGGGYSG